MHSDSKQLRRTLLCLNDIDAVLYGYRIDIALSNATETPQQRYGNMVLLEGYQSDIALIQS